MSRTRTLALLLLATASVPARGQTIDHDAFEQLFGEPVTTSAIGKPQRVSDAPAQMDIVTADDIRRSGADTIPDVLRFVAGLDVRTYGTQDSAVGIRGYNTASNPRVLVLLDGRQVYQDDYSLTVWPMIPVALSAIRQIEIIKGPNSALYGFNAVSGVINIVTYDPLRDTVNAARVDAGSLSQTYGEAVATARVPGTLGVRLSATGFRSTEFVGTAGGSTREQPHSGTAALDARVQLAPGVEWDGFASIGNTESDYYIDAGVYEPFAFKANSFRSRLSADTGIGLLQLDAYRNENGTTGSGPVYYDHWREDVVVVQASDLVKLGSNHILRLEGEYRDNSIDAVRSFGGGIGYTIFAGSLMWNWQATPRLSFTNAVRVDNLSLDRREAASGSSGIALTSPSHAGITEPSFNSGAVFKVTPSDTVRLTAARAIELPSLLDFGYSKTVLGVIVAGNTRLQPSVVQNYEVDYDRALPSLGSTLRIAAFAQHSASTIGSPFGSPIAFLPSGQPILMAKNFGASSEVGGEIGLKGSNASGLRWDVSYALAAVRDASPESQLLVAPTVSYQRQTPTHSVIVGGGYTWKRLDIDVQARWQSHIQDFTVNTATAVVNPVTVPNYVTVNARLGYRITDHVTASLLAEQLNQSRITETAGLQLERRFLASVGVRF